MTTSTTSLDPPGLSPAGAARIAQAIAVHIRDCRKQGHDYPAELDAHRAWFAALAMGRAASSGQERPTGGQPSTAHPDRPQDGPMLLTYEQAGRLMGLSERTIRRRVTDGDLPCRRVGRSVRLHRDDIRDYLDANKDQP